jgi:hypothetical protein
MLRTQPANVDSQQLFSTLLETAQFSQDEQKDMIEKFESAVYTRSLKTLLALLPGDQRRNLETTMHFQPDFFLTRVMSILQAFASADQIIDVLNKTSEETFLEFFDTFIKNCNSEQKKLINKYLDNIQPPKKRGNSPLVFRES